METNNLVKNTLDKIRVHPMHKTCIVYLRTALFSIEVIFLTTGFYCDCVLLYVCELYLSYTVPSFIILPLSVELYVHSVVYFKLILFFWNGLFDWQLHTSPNMMMMMIMSV